MTKTIAIYIMGGLLLAAVAFGVSEYDNARNIEGWLRQFQSAGAELSRDADQLSLEYDNLSQEYDYLVQQYRELERKYVSLGYLGMLKEKEAGADELANALWQIGYWKEAYQAKPGPWGSAREFRDEEELRLWLAQDNTEVNSYITHQFDCDDFARMLQARAYDDGYIISVTLVARDESHYHFKNGCFVGSKFYYIDPQTDQFWAWGHLD